MNHDRIDSSRPATRRSQPRTVVAGTLRSMRDPAMPTTLGAQQSAPPNQSRPHRLYAASTVTGNNTWVTKHDRHRARRGRTGSAEPYHAASPGETPAAQHPVRARRTAICPARQPGLDANRINLYRHHQCLRALQRGTLASPPRLQRGAAHPSVPPHTDGAHQQAQPRPTTAPATSASSMTNDHPVVVIQRDGQQPPRTAPGSVPRPSG